MLVRDVSEVRHQEQELITKDATIREIHHRVKNNLQTVASLLRIQARRTHNEVAHDALSQAMRRVAAIAVVHDTLSEGLSQNVDFDDVFDRVLLLIAEVASSHNTTVRPEEDRARSACCRASTRRRSRSRSPNSSRTRSSTGSPGATARCEITATRREDFLTVQVRDDGVGLPEGKVGSGLGTQIVRTLIQGELGGTIDWHTLEGEGTEVTIEVPLHYLTQA